MAISGLPSLSLRSSISEATWIVGEHWDAVLRVADALEASRRLTRKQVAELVMAL
jgi:hypothetical protein